MHQREKKRSTIQYGYRKWGLMHECFLKHSHGNSKNEINRDEEGKKRGVSTERSKAGTKERRPVGLSLPNQNTISVNIISYYVTRYGRSTIK